MSTDADANLGTTPVREGFAFDEAALAAWMQVYVDGFAGPLQVRQFKGGQSNPTYQLITSGKTYVLRRKPPGNLFKDAHAVEREAKVLAGLEQPNCPVAHIYGLRTDDAVIGSWFYVMDMVEGASFGMRRYQALLNTERAAIFDAMNATLAQLHQVDFTAVGLGDYGKSVRRLSDDVHSQVPWHQIC